MGRRWLRRSPARGCSRSREPVTGSIAPTGTCSRTRSSTTPQPPRPGAERRIPMTQPVTELDTRFSDRDAVATDWATTRRTLEEAELFWISTVRADGRPHVTPLVAVWL